MQGLRVLVPSAERANVLPGLTGRVAYVREAGAADPVPLRSLGHGAERAFEVFVWLAAHAHVGRPALVDEIEVGLHYGLQPAFWEAVFELATRHDVQLVATTHSWDYIDGFARAAIAHPGEGALIRLAHRDTG